MTTGRMVAAALIGILFSAGCGSGSDPPFYNQIIYRVRATNGVVSFRVDQLCGGLTTDPNDPNGPEDTLRCYPLPGRVFTLDATSLAFLLVNTPPPYKGVFTRVAGDGDAEIDAIEVAGVKIFNKPLNATVGQPTPVCLLLTGGQKCDLLQRYAGPLGHDVRFEVCSPFDANDPCSDAQIRNASGRQFTGTVGDAVLSNQIQLVDPDANDPVQEQLPATPALVFLGNPQDNVGGIFRSAGSDNELIGAMLFIDGQLRDQSVGHNDQVLKEDL